MKIESSWAKGDGGSVSEAHGLNLGNSGERATYWLIVDRRTNQSFVTAAAEAYRHVQQQRLHPLGWAWNPTRGVDRHYQEG